MDHGGRRKNRYQPQAPGQCGTIAASQYDKCLARSDRLLDELCRAALRTGGSKCPKRRDDAGCGPQRTHRVDPGLCSSRYLCAQWRRFGFVYCSIIAIAARMQPDLSRCCDGSLVRARSPPSDPSVAPRPSNPSAAGPGFDPPQPFPAGDPRKTTEGLTTGLQ